MKALLQPSLRATRAEQADSARGETVRAPRRSTAVRAARWRVATDALMLMLAGAVETLSAPAADISQSPGWRLGFVALVLAALGLRGVYRANVGQQQFLDEARTILAATTVAAMVIAFLRVALTDNYAVAEETIRGWLFAAVYLVAGRAILAIVADRFNRLGHGAPTLIVGAGQGGAPDRPPPARPPGVGPAAGRLRGPRAARGGEHPSGLPVLGSDERPRGGRSRTRGIEHAIISFSNDPVRRSARDLLRTLQRMQDLGGDRARGSSRVSAGPHHPGAGGRAPAGDALPLQSKGLAGLGQVHVRPCCLPSWRSLWSRPLLDSGGGRHGAHPGAPDLLPPAPGRPRSTTSSRCSSSEP